MEPGQPFLSWHMWLVFVPTESPARQSHTLCYLDSKTSRVSRRQELLREQILGLVKDPLSHQVPCVQSSSTIMNNYDKSQNVHGRMVLFHGRDVLFVLVGIWEQTSATVSYLQNVLNQSNCCHETRVRKTKKNLLENQKRIWHLHKLSQSRPSCQGQNHHFAVSWNIGAACRGVGLHWFPWSSMPWKFPSAALSHRWNSEFPKKKTILWPPTEIPNFKTWSLMRFKFRWISVWLIVGWYDTD